MPLPRKPEISFIIPALNEEKNIGKAIQSIIDSGRSLISYEIIVVDNGSTDRTVEIAREMGAIVFIKPHGTISSLRNFGRQKARAEILAFLDADVYLTPKWAYEITDTINMLKSNTFIITGSFYDIPEKNSWIEKFWFKPIACQTVARYINGGHLILHESLYDRIEGFDETLETGEDYDFCSRALKRGARILPNPKLKVIHNGYPKTIKAFFIREKWHGKGDFRSIKDFLHSRPALISTVSFVSMAACIAVSLIQQTLNPILIYCVLFGSFALSCALARIGKINLKLFPVAGLFAVYFAARAFSLSEVLKAKLNNE